MNFHPGDMVKVTTGNTLRIAWVVRQTAKRVTVEASNGTEKRSYHPRNVVLLHRRNPRVDLLKDDPNAAPPFRAEERTRLRERMNSDEHSRVECGILYWNANNSVIPPFVYKDAGYLVPEAQQRAYDKQLDESLGRYKRAQENMSAEARAEMAFEMRAAFGPGETVVDVLTGKTYRT